MTIKDEITIGLRNAMKEGDTDAKRTLRLALANIKNAEIDKRAELDEQTVIAIIHKELKIREEAIEGALKSNRQDLIDEANKEIAILKKYLPEGLSEDQIEKMAKEVIEQVNATSPADMGKVMKELLPKIAGRAPGNLVSRIVKDLLQE